MFVAVYWWRVHPGKEEQFRAAWRRGTEHITRIYGSYGSRLHRERDGRFVGYAEWPDEESWQRAYDAKMVYDDPETRAAFVDAIAELPPGNKPAFTMHVTDDLLTLRPTFDSVFGSLPYKGSPKSIEDMDTAVAAEAKRKAP